MVAADVFFGCCCSGDVCTKKVAIGGPVPQNDEDDLLFNLEIVCSRCKERYSRCSDCGGELSKLHLQPGTIPFLRIDVTDRRRHHTGGGGVRLGWVYFTTAKVPSEVASPAMTDQVIALIQSREVALQRALHAWPEDLSTVTRPASQCGKYAVRHESHTRYPPRRA